MSNARLSAVIDAYGADPARWPADERAALHAVAAGADPAVLRRRAEAEALDGLLACERDQPLSAAVQGAILAARPQPSPWRRLWAATALRPALATLAVVALAAALLTVEPPVRPHDAAANTPGAEALWLSVEGEILAAPVQGES